MNTDHCAKIRSVARCHPRLTKTRCPLTISPPILGFQIFALPKWEAKSVHGYNTGSSKPICSVVQNSMSYLLKIPRHHHLHGNGIPDPYLAQKRYKHTCLSQIQPLDWPCLGPNWVSKPLGSRMQWLAMVGCSLYLGLDLVEGEQVYFHCCLRNLEKRQNRSTSSMHENEYA